VGPTIKTLATKDDIANLRKEMGNDLSNLRKEMGENRAENIKWMFVFCVRNVGTMLAIALLILKK
jgi:hypothetical protein